MSTPAASSPFDRIWRGVHAIALRRLSDDARWLEIATVVAALALGAAIGTALAWQVQFVVLAAVSLAAVVWLTRSLVRGVACIAAALAFASALAFILVRIDADLPARLHIEWAWLGYAWWALPVAVAAVYRLNRPERSYSLVELVGLLVALATALRLARRISYDNDLLTLLVHVEDNQAWVGLTTIVRHYAALGPGFSDLGALMPLMLGLLSRFQEPGILPYNSTFSAYSLAVIALPIAAVGVLRLARSRPWPVTAALAVLVVVWAYQVPYLLFASYGHLSAIWAFVFALLAVSAVAHDPRSRWAAVVAIGGVLAAGAAWFPIAPFAALVVVFLVVRAWPESRRGWRIGIVLAALTAVAGLYVQLSTVTGAGAGLGEVQSSLAPLYEAKGGTAAIDPGLLLLVLALTAVVPLLGTRLDAAGHRLWWCALAAIAYTAAVFAGSFYLKVAVGYGPTKIAFILGWIVVIALIAILLRLDLQPRLLVAVIVVLGFGSLVYGGAGAVLARSWPGGGSTPIWLAPIEQVALEQEAGEPRPIGCFANQVFEAYMCTRWAAGLTPSGDAAFLPYRLKVINEQDPSAEVQALVESGVLAESDLVVLELPDANHPWGWDLIRGAGRVYRADGSLWVDPPTGP